jgi:hypothetical protein
MALTTEETARLATYRAAYDALLTGKAVAKVTNASGGGSVEYAQADKSLLKAEIDKLEAAQATCRRRGAIGFRV